MSGLMHTVLLADVRPLLLLGMKELLARSGAFEVVASCHDGRAAVEALRRFKPNIACVDFDLPDVGGLGFLRIVREEGLQTRVTLIAPQWSRRQVRAVIEKEVWGLMLNSTQGDDVIRCFSAILDGKRWLPPEIVGDGFAEAADQQRRKAIDGAEFTDREAEIIQLVLEGASNKLIGRHLGVTEGTVKVHLHNVYRKLGIGGRMALVVLGREFGADFFRSSST